MEEYAKDPAELALIVQLCRTNGGWSVPRNAPDKHPCNFHPETVRVPGRPGEYFSEQSAVEFIAQKIEEQNSVRLVELDKPPNTFGFWMVIEIEPHRKLYWKVTFNRRRTHLFIRSFHYSAA